MGIYGISLIASSSGSMINGPFSKKKKTNLLPSVAGSLVQTLPRSHAKDRHELPGI